jgi:hypothetical protein
MIRLAWLACALVLAEPAAALPVLGWVERAKIYPGEMILDARLDTGAKNGSINARDIEPFDRKGAPWVRFRIVNRDGSSLALERPLVREVKIQRHFGKRQRRPVVMLGVCVGDLYREVQVSLVNRTGFIYPMLIGRSFMKKQLVVDPAQRFTAPPKCSQAPKDG